MKNEKNQFFSSNIIKHTIHIHTILELQKELLSKTKIPRIAFHLTEKEAKFVAQM